MLTTEQIQRVERHLAEVVMGWKLEHRPDLHYNDVPYWCFPNHETLEYDDWHPCSDPAQAAMVREKMRELGKFVQIIYHSDCVEAHIGWVDCNYPTESEASSVAAFLATGGKLDK